MLVLFWPLLFRSMSRILKCVGKVSRCFWANRPGRFLRLLSCYTTRTLVLTSPFVIFTLSHTTNSTMSSTLNLWMGIAGDHLKTEHHFKLIHTHLASAESHIADADLQMMAEHIEPHSYLHQLRDSLNLAQHDLEFAKAMLIIWEKKSAKERKTVEKSEKKNTLLRKENLALCDALMALLSGNMLVKEGKRAVSELETFIDLTPKEEEDEEAA